MRWSGFPRALRIGSLLLACGTAVLSTGTVRPVAAAQRAAFAAGQPTVVVTDGVYRAALVYSLTGKLINVIWPGDVPEGVFGDAAGDIYISHHFTSVIYEYASNDKTVKAILTQEGHYPDGGSVDAATGVIAVINEVGVMFYRKGGVTPCAFVREPYSSFFTAGSFDANGNFYVDGEHLNAYKGASFIVGVIAGGCRARAYVPLATKNVVGLAGGLKIAPSGDVAILDAHALKVFTYKAPVGGSLGMPVAVTPLRGASQPGQFAFTPDGNHLFTVDAGLLAAVEYPYPQGGAPTMSIQGLYNPNDIFVTPVTGP